MNNNLSPSEGSATGDDPGTITSVKAEMVKAQRPQIVTGEIDIEQLVDRAKLLITEYMSAILYYASVEADDPEKTVPVIEARELFDTVKDICVETVTTRLCRSGMDGDAIEIIIGDDEGTATQVPMSPPSFYDITYPKKCREAELRRFDKITAIRAKLRTLLYKHFDPDVNMAEKDMTPAKLAAKYITPEGW